MDPHLESVPQTQLHRVVDADWRVGEGYTEAHVFVQNIRRDKDCARPSVWACVICGWLGHATQLLLIGRALTPFQPLF